MSKTKCWLLVILLLTSALYTKYYYLGPLDQELASPNGEYTIRFYKSNQWLTNVTQTLIGFGEKCHYTWTRLYDKQGNKLNEERTNDCYYDGIRWLNTEVRFISEEGPTYWPLPSDGGHTDFQQRP